MLNIGSCTNLYTASPSSASDTANDAAKNEGFLKSVWHRLTEKHGDSSGPSQADNKDTTGSKDSKDTGNKDAGSDASKDSSKKSS